MFRSQSSDHHQGSITVLVQLLLFGVRASSYSGMWLYVVCAYNVPVRVVSGYVHNQTPHGQVHRMHRQHTATYRNTTRRARRKAVIAQVQ